LPVLYDTDFSLEKGKKQLQNVFIFQDDEIHQGARERRFWRLFEGQILQKRGCSSSLGWSSALWWSGYAA